MPTSEHASSYRRRSHMRKPPLAGLPLEGVSCAGLVSDVYEVDTLAYSVLGNHEG